MGAGASQYEYKFLTPEELAKYVKQAGQEHFWTADGNGKLERSHPSAALHPVGSAIIFPRMLLFFFFSIIPSREAGRDVRDWYGCSPTFDCPGSVQGSRGEVPRLARAPGGEGALADQEDLFWERGGCRRRVQDLDLE